MYYYQYSMKGVIKMRKGLNLETRKEMLVDMLSSGVSIPDDITKTWGSDGGFISLETLSRITGLTPYKLRKLIKAGEFPFAKYVPSGTGHTNERGSFLISWTGFKSWLGINDTDDSNNETLQKILAATEAKSQEVVTTPVQEVKVYNKGEVKAYYEKLLQNSRLLGSTPPEFSLILNAYNKGNVTRLLKEVIAFAEKVTDEELTKYGVRVVDPAPEQ